MITFTKFKSIRSANEDYVVIPVNAVGKLQPGLMTWWADSAPEDIMRYYLASCMRGDIYPGQIMAFKNSSFILAVVKQYPVGIVSYDVIEDICENLNYEDALTKKTIALPRFVYMPWRWRVVKQIMTHHLQGARGHFYVY